MWRSVIWSCNTHFYHSQLPWSGNSMGYPSNRDQSGATSWAVNLGGFSWCLRTVSMTTRRTICWNESKCMIVFIIFSELFIDRLHNKKPKEWQTESVYLWNSHSPQIHLRNVYASWKRLSIFDAAYAASHLELNQYPTSHTSWEPNKKPTNWVA